MAHTFLIMIKLFLLGLVSFEEAAKRRPLVPNLPRGRKKMPKNCLDRADTPKTHQKRGPKPKTSTEQPPAKKQR